MDPVTLVLAIALQQGPQRENLAESEARLTGAVFSQVYENWRVNCDLPGVRNLRIAFDLRLDTDGSILGEPVLVDPQDTPVFRTAAASARRALLDTAPFEVPEGYRGGAYRPTFVLGRVCYEADED